MSTDDDNKEFYRSWKNVGKLRRERYGVDCPECPANRYPTKLLPGQRCKVDGYKDPRPRLTREQEDQIWKDCGFEKVEPNART